MLVDHRQNGWGKTIASVYSVRPKPGAPVSTPLRWEELTPDVRPRQFTMDVVLLERVGRLGDLYAAVLDDKRPLGVAAKRLRSLSSRAEAPRRAGGQIRTRRGEHAICAVGAPDARRPHPSVLVAEAHPEAGVDQRGKPAVSTPEKTTGPEPTASGRVTTGDCAMTL